MVFVAWSWSKNVLDELWNPVGPESSFAFMASDASSEEVVEFDVLGDGVLEGELIDVLTKLSS